MFPEDAHMAVDFPKWPDIIFTYLQIMEMKYIFYGPELPATITKSWFEISEDDEAVHINKKQN